MSEGAAGRRRAPASQRIYQEIAEDLRHRIQSGEFAQGDKLSTEEDLSDVYRASRNTVRQAIDRRTREGLVAKRQGQGTFVTIKVDPFVAVLSTRTLVIDGGGTEGAPYESEVEEQHRVTVYPADRNLLVSNYGDVPELLYEVEPKRQGLPGRSPTDDD